MSTVQELMVNTFFEEWKDRELQKRILKGVGDNELASILVVTSDMRAVVLAELDRRGPKK